MSNTPTAGSVDDILKRLLADVDDSMEFIGTAFNPKGHAAKKVSKAIEQAKTALATALLAQATQLWQDGSDIDRSYRNPYKPYPYLK